MKSKILGCILRLYVSLACLAGALLGFVEPRSLQFLIANDADPFGMIMLWIFTGLGFAGVIDVLINDVMPKGWIIKSSLKFRHLIFMGISVCYALDMFLGARFSDVWSTFPLFTVHAIFSAIAAFLDVHTRFGDRPENEHPH